MRRTTTLGSRIFDLAEPIDISIPISFACSVSAFGAGTPTKKTYQAGTFVGDVSQGGSCNCSEITINPHCHATHTECVGHILSGDLFVPSLIKPFWGLAQLVTVEASGIDQGMLLQAGLDKNMDALIIRTTPNPDTKKSRQYQEEAPFMRVDAMEYCNDLGISHLLVDFPSVDPINDGGKLLAHRTFWQVKEGQTEMSASVARHKSITELIYVPNQIEDGLYGLNLQMSNMELDGVPSRPLLYREIR